MKQLKEVAIPQQLPDVIKPCQAGPVRLAMVYAKLAKLQISCFNCDAARRSSFAGKYGAYNENEPP
jgi:hypothetical protein